MAAAAAQELLASTPFRVLTGTKRLTLALGGLYFANTTVSAKPLLVWETEKGYPRYYVPKASLHQSILSQSSGEKQSNGHSLSSSVELKALETVKAKSGEGEAAIERLTVNSKSTEWIRFLTGQFKDYIRFERDQIGTPNSMTKSC
jgi:hypothetical protein